MDKQFQNYNNDFLKEEKIDGKIYLMAPPCREHREVQYNITNIFNNYFKKNKKRCISIFEDRLDDEDNYYQPDIMVFCYNNSKDIPLIVIEVLSASTRERDLGDKMEKYAKLGIKEYWIVTWETLSIDIYLLTDDNRYKFYKSYALYAVNKSKKKNNETATEAVKEFSPVSVPELKVQLEDVFYFVE